MSVYEIYKVELPKSSTNFETINLGSGSVIYQSIRWTIASETYLLRLEKIISAVVSRWCEV